MEKEQREGGQAGCGECRRQGYKPITSTVAQGPCRSLDRLCHVWGSGSRQVPALEN